jgi:hypothetical protein
MSSKPLHNLVIELPGSPPRYFQLSASVIRIGRVEGNAIVVEEDAVSARHCELRRTASGGYEVLDLGSTNGTRLNGEAISGEARELHDGDNLLFGVAAKARFVRVHEIRDRVDPAPSCGWFRDDAAGTSCHQSRGRGRGEGGQSQRARLRNQIDSIPAQLDIDPTPHRQQACASQTRILYGRSRRHQRRRQFWSQHSRGHQFLLSQRP